MLADWTVKMQPISVVQIAALEGEAATSWREPTLFQAEAFTGGDKHGDVPVQPHWRVADVSK